MFSNPASYNRFVELMPRVFFQLISCSPSLKYPTPALPETLSDHGLKIR